MDRRQYLAGTLSLLSVGLAGCSEITGGGTTSADCSAPWSPDIQADEPTLTPGSKTTIHVSVSNVTSVGFGLPAESMSLGWDFDAEYLFPPPEGATDSYPPDWLWGGCTDVEMDIPLEVDETTETGEYPYSIHASQTASGEGDSLTRNFTITVSGN